MPKRPPKLERRRQILAAARAVFARRGYDNARMADIATEAGVGKGTLYEHFKGKEDLFGTLVLTHMREALESLPQPAAGLEPAEELRQTIDYLIQVALVENLDLYRLFYDFWGMSPIHREQTRKPLRESVAAFRGIIAKVLRRGQAEGAFRAEIDPGLFAYSVAAAIDGISLPLVILEDPGVDLKRHGEWLKELFVRGVSAEAPLQGASVIREKS